MTDTAEVEGFLNENPLFREMREHADDKLHPDLADCFYESDLFGACLKSPLVFQLPYYSAYLANKQYEQKKRQVAEAIADKAWDLVIWLHERPFRTMALLQYADRMTDKQFWQRVADVWIDSENLFEHEEDWYQIWTSDRPKRQHVMTPEERKLLDALPDEITVFRGCVLEQNEDGWSWSLEKERAAFFAKRYRHGEQEAIVHEGVVSKSDVLAHFIGRKEREIVVRPGLVRVHHTWEV